MKDFEKFNAIVECVNDTLQQQKDLIKYYRENDVKKDAQIEELKLKVAELESANKELSKRLVVNNDTD